MLGAGRVVALGVSPGEAVRRAGRASGRPLLDGAAEPTAAAAGLLAARAPFYGQAHFRVDTDGRSPAQIVEQIAAQLADTVRAAAPHRETA
jgi:shikimate kinase